MGHSTGISGLKTGVESLKKGQDLGKRNPTFKPNLIQIELTKKEHFLLFCSYLPQFNSITVGIVLFSKVDKLH